MAVIPVNDSNFNTQVASSPKVMVKYYADWCGSCKLFAPKFRRLSDDERFKDIVFLEINAEENPEARKLAGVDNLPFFTAFYNAQLHEAKASSKEEVVLAMLEKLVAL